MPPAASPPAIPCRQGREIAVRVLPSLSHVARSGVSERLPTLLDSRQWSCPCLLSAPLPAQGPFPRRALPRVPGTTGPSATLPARPAPRGVPVAACTAPAGLPVLLRLPSSMHADATTPAETSRCSRRSLPGWPAAFPLTQEGRLPRHPSRGLLGVHSRSGLHGRQAAQRGPLARVLQSMSLPPWTALAARSLRRRSRWCGACRMVMVMPGCDRFTFGAGRWRWGRGPYRTIRRG